MSIYDKARKLAPKLIAKFKNDSIITVQEKNRVSDGMGGFDSTWVTKFTCDGAILPVSANEQARSMQLNQETTHKLFINFTAGTPTADDRIEFDGRIFNINSVIATAEAKAVYVLMLKEGVAT